MQRNFESNPFAFSILYVSKYYYVTFIDYHSIKTWLYLLKIKDEVFEKFKEFIFEVETLTKRKINTLRSHNGGEYTSK